MLNEKDFQSLLVFYPDFKRAELKTIIRTILASRRNKIRFAQVFRLVVPKIGVFKSHGRKKHKGYMKVRSRDRRRKTKEYRQKELTTEKLLF